MSSESNCVEHAGTKNCRHMGFNCGLKQLLRRKPPPTTCGNGGCKYAETETVSGTFPDGSNYTVAVTP